MIAVVDDEESVRKALVRLLLAAGYAARGFSSGDEFMMAWPSDPPGCVLLDLQMPGLSGTDVQRALKRAGARFPLIIITAHDSSGVREECMCEGAAAYLCKPLDERVLLSAVNAAIGSPA